MTNIDAIVREVLLDSGKTIHYYLPALVAALRCVRELDFDVMGNVDTAEIVVDAVGECNIPTGYIDWTKIGYKRGKYIVPISENKLYNNLPAFDANYNQVAYGSAGDYASGSDTAYPWTTDFSVHGEHLGRQFGINAATRTDDFKVIQERGKISVGQSFAEGDLLYIEYLSDRDPTADTYVHPYAESTIKAFVLWKFSMKERLGEEDRRRIEYCNELRICRGRMDSMTKEDWLRLFRSAASPTVR